MIDIDTHIHKVESALNEEERSAWAAIRGASETELARLLEAYPQCPAMLVDLLRKIGGTYHRRYPDGYVAQPIFGSDVGEDFGYYLLSCDDMLDERRYADTIAERYSEFMGQPDIIDVAPEIDIHTPMNQWLCFAHCINNGGTSMLYIDVTPTDKGTVGQVVRYLHDPDSYIVLASSFPAYIAQLIEGDYGYVSDEDDE
ncbi:SMI1/KNR4 family protein [Zymobacter palmae]|uniref:Spermidine/putrescine-binding periplasmic protein n=1 Tax=Zymobacter palmae TaxID=33074 RepID=A0A348HFF7_9GAMM|nr:SMI1/KNR4 family protein [Zymobacter palmae]BBG30359.1 spermidine/putrescine-binding periplasmic protein [Zymobacter palmae]